MQYYTAHACVDEADLNGSLHAAVRSGKLFHVHLCENHRREYGTGAVGPRTGEILECLGKEGYDGAVVLELFCPALYGAVNMWKSPQDPIGVARNSMNYLRRFGVGQGQGMEVLEPHLL
jgi:sugar phosphate isomerase/epimerase